MAGHECACPARTRPRAPCYKLAGGLKNSTCTWRPSRGSSTRAGWLPPPPWHSATPGSQVSTPLLRQVCSELEARQEWSTTHESQARLDLDGGVGPDPRQQAGRNQAMHSRVSRSLSELGD